MTLNVLWIEEELASLRYEYGRAKELGWNITVCTTAAEASERICSEAFDLLILDLMLPSNGPTLQDGAVDLQAGTGLLSEVRNSARIGQTPPTVPVLVISAIGSPEQRAKVIQMLADEHLFIPKPIDEQVFERAIRRLNQQLTQAPTPKHV